MKKINSGFAKWAVAAVSFLVLFVIILGVSVPESYDYKVGDICEADIYAPREIEDAATTKRRREAAASQIEEQYRTDYDLTGDLEKKIQGLFASVNEIRAMNSDLEGKLDYIASDGGIDIGTDTARLLLNMDTAELSGFSDTVCKIFNTVMDKGVRDEEEAREEADTLLEEDALSDGEKNAAKEILGKYIKVNSEYDEELTLAEREKAMKQIEPAVYKKNQIILRRGEAISDSQLELLADLGLLKGENSISKKYALATLIFLSFIYLAWGYCFGRKRRNALCAGKLLLTAVLAALALLTVACARGLSSLSLYLLPIPAAVVLCATFIGIEESAVMAVFVSAAAAFMLGKSEEYLVATALYSFFGAVIFKKVSGLSGYAKAMLLTLLSGAAAAFMAALFAGKAIPEAVLYALYGGGGGLITSVIVIGTTPIFENIFNIATPFKLSELGNPEKPLLKRLMFEAPGTYHHSLMVGNLAEAACIKIGADNQLARVGAYYHDIGKLKRPNFFFENQMGDNPHDTIMPEESAEILRGHVTAGLEIAKQYRLPPEIKEIIAQHHGTTAAGIFYQKAKELNPEVDPSLFRYPGPKPESKEAGIVMLADSCEAAVRSLDDKNEATIRAMVTKIVKGKMTDGQLDECNLSFKELGEIIDAFVAIEESYFHKRIKYDKEPQNGADN